MKVKKTVTILFILIFFISLGMFSYLYYKSHKKVEEIPENVPELVEAIDTYSYQLEDRDTELFKKVFGEIKEVLNEENIDYESYAKLLSELYIIDLYTISNKVSKYDVGGSDYVYPASRDNYELKVRDTLYKYVEDNSYNTRNQELPEVSNIQIDSCENVKYTLNNKKYDGYKVTISWEYTKENDYEKKTVTYLIKEDKKLYIVEHKAA